MGTHTPNQNHHENMTSHPAEADVVLALRTDANVLVSGPRAVARGLARQIHEQSGWRHGSFRVIDCTQEEGLERELAAAFDLPVSESVGARLMQSGTVLLEEIGCMPEKLQARLAETL